MRIRSRQESANLPTLMKGWVSVTIQASVASSMSRVMSASARPTLRAFDCCSTGRRPARIEMNTRLSMPSTISSAIRVMRLAQICGSEIHSKVKNSIDRREDGERHCSVRPAKSSEDHRDLCLPAAAHHLDTDLGAVALELHVDHA